MRPLSLDETVAARLRAAGIRPDDPGLLQLRAWNQAAARAQVVRIELRRGQFGSYRMARLDEVEQ